MLKRLILLWILMVSLLLAGCRIFDKVVTHQFRSVLVQQHSINLQSPAFADLDNDGTDEMIAIENNQGKYFAIIISDLAGKVISQMNFQYPIQGVRVLNDPRDNKAWLFYSFNDGENTYLRASHYTWGRESKREDKRFDSIPRVFREGERKTVEWNGQMYPEFITDTDGDGKVELVARGLCGFQANPRGLMVYDFDKGGLEWYFRTPSNINSVFFDDLDGNGKKGFIFSTYAFKNTEEVINGIDDMNGYIVLLKPNGEPALTEMQFPGYGETSLELKENPHSGTTDIYRVISTWGPIQVKNSVSILNYNGKKLVLKKTRELADTLERPGMPGFLKPWDKDGNKRIFLQNKAKGLVVMDENLTPIKHRINTYIKYIWDVKDMDQDGDSEVLLETEDGYFMVLDNDLHVRARMKTPEPGETQLLLQTCEPGFGKNLQLVLSSPKLRYFYDIAPYSIFKLLLDMIMHYSLYVGLAFIVFALLVLHHFFKMMQVNKTATKYLDIGFIIVRKGNVVSFANIYIRKLLMDNLEADQDLKITSLRQYLPNLQQALTDMLHSGETSVAFDTRVRLGKFDEMFKVSITRIRRFPLRHLIIMYPLYSGDNCVNEKLEWAETARRLSHNVRRHITNVILALEPLENSCKNDDHSLHYVNMIRSEIETIRVFTHSFQRFTELKDYELKLQDILPSVEHCLAHIQIPENIKLIKNWTLSSVHAQIEPIRFEEAFTNIVTNAMEAMQSGGVLHITVKQFQGREGNGNNQNVLVEVEDSGYGIPVQYMEDIYKPFFTTKQSGTGIGIPETLKIVESMQGSLQIQSEEGVGTTVSIWLRGEQ